MSRNKITIGNRFTTKIPQFQYDTLDDGRGISLFQVVSAFFRDVTNNISSRWIGTGEQQLITFDAVPDAGFFKLEFADETTTDLAHDSTALDVQAALEVLCGAENVYVSGDFSTGFTIDFVKELLGRDVFLLRVLEGSGGALNQTGTTVNGSAALVREGNETGITLQDSESITLVHDLNSDVSVEFFDDAGMEVTGIVVNFDDKNTVTLTNDEATAKTFYALIKAGMGGGADADRFTMEITQNAHNFDKVFVYYDSELGEWALAQANDDDKLATHYAFAVTDNIFVCVQTGQTDVTSMLDENDDTLTAQTTYYLSQTNAGKITKIKPYSGFSQVVMQTTTDNSATIYNDMAQLYYAVPPSDEVINFNAGSGSVIIPHSLPVGAKRTVRKVHSDAGTVTIDFSGSEKTLKGDLTSISMKYQGDTFYLEKVTNDRWEFRSSTILNAVFEGDSTIVNAVDDLIDISTETYYNNCDFLIDRQDNTHVALKKGFTYEIEVMVANVSLAPAGTLGLRPAFTDSTIELPITFGGEDTSTFTSHSTASWKFTYHTTEDTTLYMYVYYVDNLSGTTRVSCNRGYPVNIKVLDV